VLTSVNSGAIDVAAMGIGYGDGEDATNTITLPI